VVRLLDVAETIVETPERILQPAQHRIYEQAIAAARDLLGVRELATGRPAGLTRTLNEAAAYDLST